MTRTGPAYMDKDNKIIAHGFDDHDEALDWIKEQVDNEVFTEQEIEYKDNPGLITAGGLRVIYIKLFGKPADVYFKDYVTNTDLIINELVAGLPLNDKYWQTFTSLIYFLDIPRYLVIYKKT